MSDIFKSMIAIMDDIGAIGKDQSNTSQGFKYRGIDDIYNALHGIMAKHGVISVPTVMGKERTERTTRNGGILAFTCLTIKYTFYALDGSNIECVVEGEGMDSGDKSSNKAMAVGHKYALLQVFCIPTSETKDPDAESFEIAGIVYSDAQKKEFDILLDGEAYDFWLFLQSVSDETKLALYSSFPKGTITAHKKHAREQESKGSILFAELKQAMIVAIEAEDLDELHVIGEELGTGKKLAFSQLSPELQHNAKELAQ